MSQPTIVVHHLEKSRSHRILWLLAELALPYELKIYRRDPKTMRADPALRQIHPLGKSPVVEVDGQIFAESGHIIESLVDGPGGGRLRPEEPEARRQYDYWMHYAEGSLMPPLLIWLIFQKVKQAPVPFFVKPIAKTLVTKVDEAYTGPELRQHTRYLDDHLKANAWFAGASFSAADIQMSYPVEALMHRGGGEAPHVKAWVERIRARDAYKEAEARGGPNVMPS